MVRNPEVFLLDEPLSNLDAKLRGSMRSAITKLHRQLDSTLIYVTHDQVEAMTMADRIVVMKAGYIQQVDTPQVLYDHPINMFVAGFIGAPQMNIFDVVVEKKGEDFVGYSTIQPFRCSLVKRKSGWNHMSARPSLWVFGLRIFMNPNPMTSIRPKLAHFPDISSWPSQWGRRSISISWPTGSS